MLEFSLRTGSGAACQAPEQPCSNTIVRQGGATGRANSHGGWAKPAARAVSDNGSSLAILAYCISTLHRRMHHTWSAASPSGPGPAAASTASSKHAAAMQDKRQGPPSRLLRHLLRCCVSGDGAPACPIAAQLPGDAALPPVVPNSLRPTTQLRHRQQSVISYVPVCRW